MSKAIIIFILGVIKKSEIPAINWIYKNMKLDVYFDELPCHLYQGPLGLYYTATDEKGVVISSISQYPLPKHHLVVENLDPYVVCNVNIYFIRAKDKVSYDISFMPVYEGKETLFAVFNGILTQNT